MPVLTGKIGISSPKESTWWSDPPIPAANALARADGLGLRRHAIERKSPRKGTKTIDKRTWKSVRNRYWKKVPKKGDENFHCHLYIDRHVMLIERKSPRKGTKTTFDFRLCGFLHRGIERKSPRKGTKTLSSEIFHQRRLHWKKVPKKGDENSHSGFHFPLNGDWKKVPKKGDENNLTTLPLAVANCIERKSPRKGTKTSHMPNQARRSLLIERKSPRKGTKTSPVSSHSR